MNVLAALAAVAVFGGPGDPLGASPAVDQPLNIKPPKSRFELQDPVNGLPAVMLDWQNDSIGLAQQATRGSQKYQARILWIDATANIERYNTEEKIVALVKSIQDVGFNTIIYDVKPISGQVVYRSTIAPKLTEWKGRQLPADFDPLAIFTREARKDGITLCVSLNAFSEGHQIMHSGPAYSGEMSKWQTVLYSTKMSVWGLAGTSVNVSSDFNKLAPGDQQISAFNETAKLPAALDDTYFCTAINRFGFVTSSESGANLSKVKLPNLGSILIGQGSAANFLRMNGVVGQKLAFKTLPEFVRASERPEEQTPLMVNPLLHEVQEYERSIVREILTSYDVDGIVYDDRLRFGGIDADFSDYSQFQFEKYIGRRISWPDDVYRFTFSPGLNRGLSPGPYYEAWLTWRAQNLRNYVLSVRQLVKTIKPKALFGVYAGSWYGDYQRFGNNWAAPETDAGFWFLTPEYAQTGIAPQLDFLITGCYYPTATIKEAMEMAVPIGFTVESAGHLSNRMVRDQSWTYAGLSLDQFRNNPDGLRNAIQAACGATQGVMVFDLSHDFESSVPVFLQAFRNRVKAPHDAPGLLADVRKRRAAIDKLGKKDSPVIVNGGSTGAGM